MANVVFLWHMHQPYYVDPATQTATMPWVRLHCVKGYLDMITVIEDFPAVRVNFNLSPVLMLQIKELLEGTIRDRWLDWSRKAAVELDDGERCAVLENFFKLHWDHMIKPHPRYWELLHKRGLTFYGEDVRRSLRYWTAQELLDLQVWFNLAWCGYASCRRFPELAALRQKGRGFTEEDKQRVLDLHLEIMRLIPRLYRAAEERGQVELTTTPFFHPILPLIYDSSFAARSLPGRKFPARFHWPEDAAAHLTLAVEQHAAIFGRPPRGLWPSEGSIAPELIPLMQRCGIEYFCSDEENLFNSIKRDPAYRGAIVDHLELFQGWRVQHEGAAVNALFREKPLSDFIGFMAAKNDPGQAAQHLLFHLRHISELISLESGVIPLILDGENAWETFADGGEGFLRALYGGIEADSERLHSCTIEDYFHHHPPQRQLTSLHTGSWIGSNFDLWIGEAEENRAWDLLGETRAFLQRQIDSGALRPEQQAAALREIYAAEGSDWFWWYGPDFSTDNDALFDDLFRQHLRSVYRACGQLPPAVLEAPIAAGRARARYELPRWWITPPMDGSPEAFFDWRGAGRYLPASEAGAMYRAERCVSEIQFGNDGRALYLRIALHKAQRIAVGLAFLNPAGVVARTGPLTGGVLEEVEITSAEGRKLGAGTVCVTGSVIRLALPLELLDAAPGGPVAFQVKQFRDGMGVESYPESAPFEFKLLDADWALEHWIV